MPIQPDPQSINAWPNQVNIPATMPGLFMSLQIQTDGTVSQQDQDDTLQSLIDHLQTWSGRQANADVTGQKYQVLLYAVTPTNPIPLPDPPEDPPGA